MLIEHAQHVIVHPRCLQCDAEWSALWQPSDGCDDDSPGAGPHDLESNLCHVLMLALPLVLVHLKAKGHLLLLL